jgi:hypothetical protein
MAESYQGQELESDFMKTMQVSKSCFAVLNNKNRMCDANSGLINLGGGVVIDTQSNLRHARQMIELFGKVWAGMRLGTVRKVARSGARVHQRRAGLPRVPKRAGGCAQGFGENL